MSYARRYAVWPDPRSRSRSRALQSLNPFHFQNLSPPPFTMGAGKWPLILKVEHGFLIFVLVFVSRDSELDQYLSGDFRKKISSDLNEISYVGIGRWVMHDGMLYGRNQGQGQGQGHSREVDRQSPTGLIFMFIFTCWDLQWRTTINTAGIYYPSCQLILCAFSFFLHYTDAFVAVLISSFLKHATVRWRCRAAAASGSLWRCNRLIYRSCGDASRAARRRRCCGGWRKQHLDVGLHVWPALCVQITGSWRIDAPPSTSPVTSSSSQPL